MALTRRDFLWTVPLCLGALWGCTSTIKGDQAGILHEISKTKDAPSDSPTIVVFMPDTPQTEDVWKGLTDELANDYQLVSVLLTHASESQVIAKALDQYKPKGLILMNNPTVSAYRQLQKTEPKRIFPPAVVVMTSFLESQGADLHGVTGISYEVPLITAMTNLRRLLVLQRERVGVVTRASLGSFVKRQADLAAREQVLLVQEEVSQSPNPSELKRAIRRLKQRCDVLWILNDDQLLTPKLISEAWIPGLDERPWLPTIVGAASLVSAKSSFGTFAVLPDHVALGSQAGSLLLDIAGEGWKVDDNSAIQLPLSTTTTIDLNQAKERFTLQRDALQQVDRILE